MKEYFNKNPRNTLIHFTSSLESILSILKDQHLRLKYCKEEFAITDEVVSKAAHPVVSFSEQNLDALEKAEITYGAYGISFNSGWIIKNKIQPIIYVEKDSPVAKSLADLLIYRRSLKKGNSIRLSIMTIKCFVKNTIGYNQPLEIEDFVFKNENEWRYVPTKSQINNGFISESRSVYKVNRDRYNQRLLDFPLRFQISDVLKVYYNTPDDLMKLMQQFPDLSNKFEKSIWKYKPVKPNVHSRKAC